MQDRWLCVPQHAQEAMFFQAWDFVLNYMCFVCISCSNSCWGCTVVYLSITHIHLVMKL